MNVNERLLDYAERLSIALQTVDPQQLSKAYDKLKSAYLSRRDVYVCGNGGSLTMGDHFVCDHGKGTHYDADFHPKIQALTSGATLTAIANDIGYDDVFSVQVDMKGSQDDILVAISASGNSPNIIKALVKAKEKGLIADIVIHVEEDNYGIIEDAHQSIMHILAQGMREEYHSGKKELKL